MSERLIPACAGTTPTRQLLLIHTWAHPRLRGDYTRTRIAIMPGIGSSPPARGLPIPLNFREYGRMAHPRLRGDYQEMEKRKDLKTGSSPPARGLPKPCTFLDSTPRLIPACAGTTQAFTIFSRRK